MGNFLVCKYILHPYMNPYGFVASETSESCRVCAREARVYTLNMLPVWGIRHYSNSYRLSVGMFNL